MTALAIAQSFGAPVHDSLERGLRLLALTETVVAPAPKKTTVVVRLPRPKKLPTLPPPAKEPVVSSAWDPDTPYERIEASRYRALLLEVVKRAIHDWILYRNHRTLELRQIAENAFTWLFQEDTEHPWYKQRELEGNTIMSFLVICDVCDLDPGYVRMKARQTTIKQIMTAGRPAERRRPNRDVRYEEHPVETVSIDQLEEPSEGRFGSDYEQYFSTVTPGYS